MDHAQSDPQPVVFVVDDDARIRRALSNLLHSVNLQVKTLTSATEFLSIEVPDTPCCLILDVRLPGLGGLEFQTKLASVNIKIPIIFITAHGDIPMSVRAMKAGAVEFLTKPFRDQDLLEAVHVAIERDKTRHESSKMFSVLRRKFATLSAREQEVMRYVTKGFMNKQIAAKIGVTENTVKVHRGNMTKKMEATSTVELAKMADILGIHNIKS